MPTVPQETYTVLQQQFGNTEVLPTHQRTSTTTWRAEHVPRHPATREGVTGQPSLHADFNLRTIVMVSLIYTVPLKKKPHRSSTVPTLYCDGTHSELLAYCERTMSEPRANHERYGTVDDTCTQDLPVEEDSY